MPEKLSDTLYLKRYARPNHIPPEMVVHSPETAFRDLLYGYVWLTDKPYRPETPLDSRGHYGSEKNFFQFGRFSYNVLVALPREVRTELPEVALYYQTALGQKRIPLNDATEIGEYPRVFIPPSRVANLLPYTVIHGGLTKSDLPLEKLYWGEEAEEILEAYYKANNLLPDDPFEVRLRKLRDLYSDEVPGKIVHSNAPNNRFKVRKLAVV